MKYKLAELLCVILIIIFVAFSISTKTKTKKSATEISAEIIKQIDISELSERDSLFFSKTFGCASNEFESIAYYSSDDVMNVSEILVIKLSDRSPSLEIYEQLEEYTSSRYDTYAAYAPDQGDQLKNRILERKGNVIFMYIGNDEQTALDAFNRSF